jgi:hypothetical protein
MLCCTACRYFVCEVDQVHASFLYCSCTSACRYLVERVTKCKLAYLHMVEDRIHGDDDKTGGGGAFSLDPYRKVMLGLSSAQAIQTGNTNRQRVSDQVVA